VTNEEAREELEMMRAHYADQAQTATLEAHIRKDETLEAFGKARTRQTEALTRAIEALSS
jgi:hypothetical protein